MKKIFTPFLLLLLGLFSASELMSQAVLYETDFESGIPGTWSQTTADATSNGFEHGTSISLSSEYFPIPVHTFFVAANDDKDGCWTGSADPCSNRSADRLIMPSMDFSSVSNPRLVFDRYYIQGTFVYTESAAVQASTDNGASWTTVKTLAGAGEWVTELVDLSAYGGMPDVKICFLYNDGGGWLFGLAVDDVSIIEPPAYDMAATDLVVPNSYEVAGSRTIQGSLLNNGSETITSLTLNYSISGGVTVSENISGLNITPLGTYNFTHPSAWMASASGSQQIIEVWASNLNGYPDEVPANDRLSKGLYIVDASQTTPRHVLFEHFTSSNCAPCASQNPAYFSTLGNNTDIATNLSYHVWWPYSTDPFYNSYTAGPQARVSYYNNVFAPWAWMDGNSTNGLAQVNNLLINNRRAYPALFEIEAYVVISAANELQVSGNLKSLAPYWGTDVSLHIVVMEEYIPGPNPDPNPNSENKFENVVRQMLPSHNGTAVIALNAGGEQTFSGNWPMGGTGVNPDEIAVVIFVQDNSTKAVMQGAYFKPGVSGLEELPIASQLQLYPNPAQDFSVLRFDLEQSASLRVELYDLTGRVIQSLSEQNFSQGQHTMNLNLSELHTGVYFVALVGENGRQHMQFHVIR